MLEGGLPKTLGWILRAKRACGMKLHILGKHPLEWSPVQVVQEQGSLVARVAVRFKNECFIRTFSS